MRRFGAHKLRCKTRYYLPPQPQLHLWRDAQTNTLTKQPRANSHHIQMNTLHSPRTELKHYKTARRNRFARSLLHQYCIYMFYLRHQMTVMRPHRLWQTFNEPHTTDEKTRHRFFVVIVKQVNDCLNARLSLSVCVCLPIFTARTPVQNLIAYGVVANREIWSKTSMQSIASNDEAPPHINPTQLLFLSCTTRFNDRTARVDSTCVCVAR